MTYEIIQVGPTLIEKFEADTVEQALARFATYDPKNHNLFVMPLRYRVDPQFPQEAVGWAMRATINRH